MKYLSSAVRVLVVFLGFFAAVEASGQNGLVISQVYGGGGNSAATYSADFIELYNPTSSPIATSGLSVQYASATGNFTQSLALSAATIQPGHFFLVQTTTSGAVGASLPTPDTTGSAPNLSATAGKVALVNGTAALSGDTTCALIQADTQILDFVGYGATASCFAGSSYAPGPTGNATSLVRTNLAMNARNNATDFSLLSPPTPRNSFVAGTSSLTASGSANPAAVTAGQTTVLTVTVVPATSPVSTGITVVGDLRLIGGSQTQALASNGGGAYTFTAPVTTSATGSLSLPITVSDAQARTAAASIALTVTQPAAFVAIHAIQGQKSTTALRVSPYAGQRVMTSGVVTTVLSNAFFIQARDSEADADPTTPEGIEIFTSSAPPAAVALGNYVQVTGTVQTYPAVTVSHTPATEITSPTISLMSMGNPMPTAVTLTTATLTPGGGLYQLTPYEGMRVAIASATTTSGTTGSITSANEATETATSTGYFYAVLTGTPRPFREPGIDLRDPAVPGEPAGVGIFDDNPERILIDTVLSGGASIELSTGAVLTNVTGVLDFTFSSDSFYDPSRLILDASYNRANVTAGMTVHPVPLPAPTEFTVASYNIERFYNTSAADDLYYVPAGVNGYNGNSNTPIVSTGQTFTSAATDVTAAAYARRLQKLSLAIRTVLNSPDIVTLEEVENQSVARDIAAQINTDAGVPNLYSAYGSDNSTYFTQDGTGISVGFLVKNTVDNLGISQYGAGETFSPASSLVTLNDRPWLVLSAGVKRPGATDYPVTVIVNHMKALTGVNSTTSVSTRLKKELQAEDIARYIQGLQASGKHVVSGGDLNAFEFSDGYTDTLATYTNVNVLPATRVVQAGVAGLTTPPLVDLVLTLPAGQRWSYQEDGSAQVLDHLVATQDLVTAGAHMAFAHLNADFPLTAYNDATTPARTSDHDVAVGYFTLPAPVRSASLTPGSADFGTVPVLRQSATGQVFVVTNTGEAFLSLTVTTAAEFPESDTCTAQPLAPGASCNINVVFSPVGLGARMATLTVQSVGLAGPLTAALTGTSVTSNIVPPVTFLPGTTFRTGSSAGGGIAVQSAVADFNGDGKQDIVTANLTNSSISILFGNGDGSFQAPVNYSVGAGPYGIVARDFNGDGKADVAVVSGASGNGLSTLSILLNDGKGGFPAQPTFVYPVQFLPYGLSTADLNNDGNLDLVVSNTGAGTVSVLLGKGDGSFQPQAAYSVGGLSFQTALADLNGDGYKDIVTANLADNTVGVLLNDKTGKFLPMATYPTGNAPFSLTAGDFNGDKLADIAVTDAGDKTVSILRSRGDGTLLPRVTYSVGTAPTSVVAADMNGDGVLDLSVANLADNTVSLLLGTGSGSFLPQAVTPTAVQPYSLVAADFNNDGRPDLSVSFYEYYSGVLIQKAP